MLNLKLLCWYFFEWMPLTTYLQWLKGVYPVAVCQALNRIHPFLKPSFITLGPMTAKCHRLIIERANDYSQRLRMISRSQVLPPVVCDDRSSSCTIDPVAWCQFGATCHIISYLVHRTQFKSFNKVPDFAVDAIKHCSDAHGMNILNHRKVDSQLEANQCPKRGACHPTCMYIHKDMQISWNSEKLIQTRNADAKTDHYRALIMDILPISDSTNLVRGHSMLKYQTLVMDWFRLKQIRCYCFSFKHSFIHE